MIHSYVSHGDDDFFVSTIERDSSAALDPPPRFYETIVWEFDWKKNKRGAQVGYAGDNISWSRTHFKICESLHDTGEIPNDD